MRKSIYISGTTPSSGKFMTSLGFLQHLLLKTPKVAYFRPVIPGQESARTETVQSYFNLAQSYEKSYAFTCKEISQHGSQKKKEELLNTIFEKHRALEKEHDYVVVEGLDFFSNNLSLEYDLNVQIPQSLNLPVVLIIDGSNKTTEDILNDAEAETNRFLSKNCEVWSLLINKANPKDLDTLKKKIHKKFPNIYTTVIPFFNYLKAPSITEILEATEAKIINNLNPKNKIAKHILVGSMLLENYLNYLKDNGTFVVTAGDRSDIILGTLQAHLSENYPTISGILLCGNLIPSETVMKLISGLNLSVPILSTKKNVFDSTQTIHSINSKVRKEDEKKVKESIKLSHKYIDFETIESKLSTNISNAVTPMMFQHMITQKALGDKKHIVLPEGNDNRVLQAAYEILKQKLAKITILGNEKEIKSNYLQIGLSISEYESDLTIIDPCKSKHHEPYSKKLYELRKEKGLILNQAKDLMLDVSYFGTMMVYMGQADGMVSGAAHTTQHTIRPALQFIKSKPGISTVSSVFFMLLPNKVAVYGDCAIVPNPTDKQLADIALSASETAIQFGIDPKIAMLSYSSGNSGSGEQVDKVRTATNIVKERNPKLKIEGPIQYDAAVDPSVGKKKLPNSEIAGNANVLIFPDLNTGNNTYKAVQREGGILAVGPILQGLNKPINDLSRGAKTEDIFNTIVITAIQAQNTKS